MVQRKERNTSECPQCGAQNKHTEHIILCPDKTAEITFSQALAEMGTWLSKTTNKEIETAITKLVLEYRQGADEQDTKNDSNNNNKLNDYSF